MAKEKIYNPKSVDMLLGCLLIDNGLVDKKKYPLDKNDFCLKFQKIIYGAINNLYKNKSRNIGFIELDSYLSKYETPYEVFNSCGGRGDPEEYIETIMQLADLDNYEYYYNEVRKLSLIRDYRDSGNDVSKYWDYEKSDKENLSNVENITLQDIIDYFDGIQSKIKRKYSNNKVEEEYLAGTDFMETKERCKETPLLGNSFQSGFTNAVFRGMFGFILRVAKSGGGKSVLSLGDLCKTSIKEYWDLEKKEFIVNKSRVGSGLFINTELELREQLDVATIAWISGVERNKIIDGDYTKEEEDRLDYANKILLDSHLYFVDDPEFTCSSLEETITDYVVNKGVETVCFDYISDNGFVGKEISKETKVPQRQDMILLELTARLKQAQRKTGCCLISSVQTNGTEDNMDYPTNACLAGGKSQERKTDGVFVMIPPTKKELESISGILAKINKGTFGENEIYPNNVCHIIKGRNTKYPKHIKIFQNVDLGTLRSVDLFCTDKNNKPIEIEPLEIIKE